MQLMKQTLCKQCGQPMTTVAEIAPMGRGPGLVAFLCADCGASDSTLVYPSNRGTEQKQRDRSAG
jgi:RNase P subunit RPR2